MVDWAAVSKTWPAGSKGPRGIGRALDRREPTQMTSPDIESRPGDGGLQKREPAGNFTGHVHGDYQDPGPVLLHVRHDSPGEHHSGMCQGGWVECIEQSGDMVKI